MTQPPQYPAQPPYNYQASPAAPGYPQPSGPTYPQNQTFPGQQPPQPGSTYPQQTQPTSQPYPQQPATPPPPSTDKTKTGIIITMGALLIALVIAVVYLAITKNNPTANPTPSATPSVNTTPSTTFTPTPTPGRGWTINGNQLTGPNMTAQLPQGWQTTELNGANNDGDLIDPRNYNAITYWAKFPAEGNAEAICRSRIDRNRMAQDDPIEPVSGQTWGGKSVLAYRFTSTRNQHRGILGFYCLENGDGTVAVLQTTAWEQYKESMRRDLQTVMTTWQWK